MRGLLHEITERFKVFPYAPFLYGRYKNSYYDELDMQDVTFEVNLADHRKNLATLWRTESKALCKKAMKGWAEHLNNIRTQDPQYDWDEAVDRIGELKENKLVQAIAFTLSALKLYKTDCSLELHKDLRHAVTAAQREQHQALQAYKDKHFQAPPSKPRKPVRRYPRAGTGIPASTM